MFDFCNDFISAVPNILIRSCLFSCKRLPHDREFIHEKLMFSQSNYSLTYTGYEMNELDGQVFNALVRICKQRNVQPGNPAIMKRSDIVKEMKKMPEGGTYDLVWRSVKRLKHATVEMRFYDKNKNLKREVLGSLISSCGCDDNSNYFVIFDPVIASLYEEDTTSINFNIRSELNSMLTRWMFDLISSNSTYIPLRIDNLHKMSGSQLTIGEFKRQLTRSLTAIHEVAPSLFNTFEYDEKGFLRIIRSGSKGVRKVTCDMSESEKLESIVAQMEACA